MWSSSALNWALSFLGEESPQSQTIFLQGQPAGLNVCSSFKSYTALGDSYACGFGSLQRLKLCNSTSEGFGSSCTTSDCGQDNGGYSWRFKEQHRIPHFQYLACNGIDSIDVLDKQINTPSFGDPDLITVNMGGDDESFFRHIVVQCIVQYDYQKCQDAIGNASTIINTQLPTRYKRAFNGLKSKVGSGTKVVAMGYAQFWGRVDANDCAWPLNKADSHQKRLMNELARNMSDALEAESRAAGFLFGDVDAAFEGQRLCDLPGKDSFKSLFQAFPKIGWDTGNEFYWELSLAHPTFEGQDIMLKVLNDTLQC